MTVRRSWMPLLLLWLVGGSVAIWGQKAEKSDPAAAEIPRFLEPTPRIGTGGQPSNEGFHALARKGYKAVINLRTPDEGVDLEAEKALIEKLGLRYFNIPVVTSDPKEEQADQFLKIMDELRGEKVFIHCAGANRVGGFLMIDRALREGQPADKAEKEAEEVGLRSDVLRKFARDFIERHKKQ